MRCDSKLIGVGDGFKVAVGRGVLVGMRVLVGRGLARAVSVAPASSVGVIVGVLVGDASDRSEGGVMLRAANNRAGDWKITTLNRTQAVQANARRPIIIGA